MKLSLGVDIGSTTAKIVVLRDDTRATIPRSATP